MKNLLIILLLSSFLLTSCLSQKIVTPPDKKIELATSEDNCKLTSERRDWYIWWGLASPKEIDTTEMLTDVNHPVIIKIGKWSDVLLGFATLGFGIPQTIRVYECEK